MLALTIGCSDVRHSKCRTMNTHQGYTAGKRGAVCSKCEDKIPPHEEAVLMGSVEINEKGTARPTAKAYHGILCMGCYEEL